jgi:hypothetical protein
VHALQRALVPGGVLVGRADEQDVAARGIGAGLITFPRDFDILAPSGPRIIPWVNSASNGSWTSSSSMSASALTKKRAYIRCRIACSTPPMYWSTAIHRFSTSRSQAAASLRASQ